MRPIDGKRLCKAMEAKGWLFIRQRSSHHVYKHPDSTETISVPVHGAKLLRTGTQRAIMRQAGLTDDDL